MIDLNKTVLFTIEDKIKREAFQGVQDPEAHKLILKMIILQDLMEWCEVLDDSEIIKKLIQNKQYELIAKHSDVWKIVRDYCSDETLFYRNVNTPQSRYTWQRVFDKGQILDGKNTPKSLHLGEVISENDYLIKNSCFYGK